MKDRIISFLAGSLLTGVATYILTRSYYEQKREEQVKSVIEAFKKEMNPKGHEEAEKAKNKPAINEYVSVQNNREAYTSFTTQYATTAPSETLKEPDIQMAPVETKRAISVITPQEFEESEFEARTLYWFSRDGVLTDSDYIPIEDIRETVGDALEHIGQYEYGCVHARDATQCLDYDIQERLEPFSQPDGPYE